MGNIRDFLGTRKAWAYPMSIVQVGLAYWANQAMGLNAPDYILAALGVGAFAVALLVVNGDIAHDRQPVAAG